MRVVHLTSDWESAWKQYIESSAHGTVAHRIEWRNIVTRTYGHRPCYLMAFDQEQVSAILPLFLVNSRLFGRFLVTAPYLSHGGLLAEDQEGACTLIHAAREMALEHKAKYVEVRGLNKIGQGLHLKDKYCTLLLRLHADPNELWRNLQGRARRAVRKALKLGLQVERGHHLVEAFADVMSQRMRDLGTPFHRAPFYHNIVREFPQQAEILMARYMGQYVGGLLLVTCRETVHWPFGGALTQSRSLAPMSLLIWEAIRYGCEHGLMAFDFGRSQWDSSTFFFKRQWGAQPLPMYYE